jgi:phospholipid-transporting ATPase
MYNFYKNMLLVLPVFFYGFKTGFSAITFYDTSIQEQFYNVLYTSFPIIVFALWDEEYYSYKIEKRPHLYIPGRLHEVFNIFHFWKSILLGMY